MDLKIVTFNIRCDYGQDGENQFCYRKDLIKNKIEKEHPDIILIFQSKCNPSHIFLLHLL